MIDTTELKRLAEALIVATDAYMADECNDYLATNWAVADDAYQKATLPETVLALIAENERLAGDEQEAADLCDCLSGLLRNTAIEVRGPEEPLKRHGFHDLPSRVKTVVAERDQLRTEVAGLKTGYEAYERVNAGLKAEVEGLRKRIDDMSPFKGAPLLGPDAKCLACGGYHYGMGGLPCPNMRVMAQADLPETRSGQIGAAMGKGEQSEGGHQTGHKSAESIDSEGLEGGLQ